MNLRSDKTKNGALGFTNSTESIHESMYGNFTAGNGTI